MGFNGPVAINVCAVRDVMDIEEVRDQRTTLEKVQLLSMIVLSEQHKAREDERDNKE